MTSVFRELSAYLAGLKAIEDLRLNEDLRNVLRAAVLASAVDPTSEGGLQDAEYAIKELTAALRATGILPK